MADVCADEDLERLELGKPAQTRWGSRYSASRRIKLLWYVFPIEAGCIGYFPERFYADLD